MHPLDNAAWSALGGAHATMAERRGQARRYPLDVSPFAAIPDHPDAAAWSDLAELAGPDGATVLFRAEVTVPAGWGVRFRGRGVQLVATGLRADPDPGAEVLGAADAEQMLALVARTRPGPFLPRTPSLGTYLGLRDGSGRLVAMAGERLRPQGFTEISAVCTDPAHRGRGLASRLVRAVAAGIRARGETPFLHAAHDNEGAIRLYLSMGFTHRRDVTFAGLQAPERPGRR